MVWFLWWKCYVQSKRISKKKITDESEEELEESTTTVSTGPFDYATPGFAPSKFMGTAGKKGKAVKKKITFTFADV